MEVVTRDKNSSLIKGMYEFASDSVAAMQLSQMWIITGDTTYAAKSLEILNGWGKTLKGLNGTDGQLAAALSGSNIVNAAEIIRYTYNSIPYSAGWTASDIAIFSTMVTDVLVPPASLTNSTAAVSNPFQANWGSSGEKFMLAAGMFTDNATVYIQAKELMLYSSCANISGSISSTGQASESGRDQQYTQLGLGNYIEAFTILHNQHDNIDWFSYLDNRLATGLEYTAKYLLNETVPYDASFYRCDANLLGGPWSTISKSGLWPVRPIWELCYAIYTSVKGVAMPYTKALIELNTPDGQSPRNAISDGSAFQTLRLRRSGSGLSSNITSS